MLVYLDGKHKHMIWQSYNTHPPVTYVPRKQARLCHFITRIPKHNSTAFIKEIEHVLFTPGLSRDYAATLKQAPRIEEEFHSENCKAVFVPSDSTLRQVGEHIDTSGSEHKLHLVLPAYPDQPDHCYEHAKPFTILTISNKFWAKGIPLAIEVFRELRKTYGQDVRMKLVCDSVPDDYPLVEGLELIQVRRLNSKLRRKLYREADVFLLLSLIQFGIVLEAMAHGVPSVSTPNYHRGGWIVRGDTGLIVDPPLYHYDEGFGIEWETWDQFQETVKMRFERGDLSYMIAQAVTGIEFLMNSPRQLRLIGQAAQRQQREKHSIEGRNEQVRQVYADILKGLS